MKKKLFLGATVVVAVVAGFIIYDYIRCSFFDELEGLTIEEQIDWLQDKQDVICNEHTECIAESHQLTSAEIADVEEERIPSNDKVYTLREILHDKPCGYGEYISFWKDSTGTISMSVEPHFRTDRSCYSIPLFYGIQKNHPTVGLDTNFHFFEAELGSYTTIVFVIDGVATGYFDYSRWPKLFPEKSPL